MSLHKSICRVCHNACPIVVEVVDGRAINVTGDRDAPVHHGYTCVKGRALPAIENSPNRLLHSLKRGPDGLHRPIPSSVAIDEIAAALTEILAKDGPRAIAHYGGTKMMVSPPAGNMADALFDAIGSNMRFTSNTIDQPGKAIAKGLMGVWMAPPQGFNQPSCVLYLGTNGLVSYGGIPTGHPGNYLKDLDHTGAATIVVDPRRTQLAARATLHLQCRPGHDAAILACLIGTILEEGLEDREFVSEHVEGLEQLRTAVRPFTPEFVMQLADVPAKDLVRAAHIFGRARRGYAVAGTGPNMGAANGTLVEYLILALDAICGHYLRAGEHVANPGTLIPNVSAQAQAAPPFPAYGFGEQMRFRELSESLAGPPTAALPEEILTPGEGRIRALFVLGGNPASAWPDQISAVEALKDLELLVTIDPEMSLTAQLAHYVIAPRSSLETPGYTLLSDLLLFYGTGVAGFSEAAAQYTPAIAEPPASSDLLDDWELYYELARRMRLPLHLRSGASFVPGSPAPVALDMENKPSTEELMDLLTAGSRIPLSTVRSQPGQHLYPSDIVVAPKEPGWQCRLNVGNSDMMNDLRVLARTSEQSNGGERGRPFRLLSRREQHVLNSSHNIPETNRGRPFNVAYLHPDDLAAVGMTAGDLAELRSARASVHAVVAADPSLRRGCVSMTHCFGELPGDDDDPRQSGTSTARLLSATSNYDRYSGQPLMSNVPVSVTRLGD